MRKEQSQFSWSWENENSAYKKSDYQNKFYNGKWQKGWIKIYQSMRWIEMLVYIRLCRLNI